MPVTSLLLGLGAGAVSALLFASAASGTLIGVLVLFLLSPLPVAITGLGWGAMTAAVAALSAATGLALVATLTAGVMHLLAIGLPTVFLSYLLLLRRDVVDGGPGTAPRTQWYPIGRVLGFAALWAGVLAVFALMTIATDIDGLRAGLRRSAERFFGMAGREAGGNLPSPPLGEAEIVAWTELMTISFAASVGMTWMLLSSLNLWLAGRVTVASKRLARPWPDLTLMRLPAFAVVGFASAVGAGVLLSLAGQTYLALVASGFASAFLFECMLVGLAIIHFHTRHWPLRPLALGATYAGLMLAYPWSHFAAALLAISEPALPVRRLPEDSPPPQ
jgi:hypothetical protein